MQSFASKLDETFENINQIVNLWLRSDFVMYGKIKLGS
jgi:hypothetical protein